MTDRTCPRCAVPAASDAAFCSECGAPLPMAEPVGASAQAPAGPPADATWSPEAPTTAPMYAPPAANGHLGPNNGPPPVNGQHGSNGAPPTNGHHAVGYAPPQTAWGYGPPPGGPPPGYAPAPYQPAQPPERRSGAGPLVALAIACVVALAGIGAAILVAVGGGGDEPVQATNAAQTAPRTVTEYRDPPRATPRRQEQTRPRRQPPSAPSGTPASPPPAVTPVARQRSTPRVAEKAAVENTVERHWQLIESGQYDAAFDTLAIPQSRAGWVAEHQKDSLSSVDVAVSATVHSSTSATAQILTLRTVANSGCFTWSGSYDMTKSGGSWKISKSNLSRSPC